MSSLKKHLKIHSKTPIFLICKYHKNILDDIFMYAYSGRLPTRRAKTLQEETAGPGANQRAVVLQHLLEDANQRKIENEKVI